MATFHTNGRIISSTSKTSFSQNSTSVPIINSFNNKIRSAYASKIISKNSSSVTNELTAPEQPQNHIQYIAEAVNITTLQQPQQKNNQVAFAFGKNKDNKKVAEIICGVDNNGDHHPENGCYICWYGKWTHQNDLTPSKCGKWVYKPAKWDGGPGPPNTCEFQPIHVPPCYTCRDNEGLVFMCDICEDCVPDKESDELMGVIGQHWKCKNICPGNLKCKDNECVKECFKDNDCSWQDCNSCINGKCQSICSSGERCIDGMCLGECFPQCNKLACENCVYRNGVYGCVSPPNKNEYGVSLACCDGKLTEYFENACVSFDTTTCKEINNCPPGTACHHDNNDNYSCRPIGCSADSDCNSECCEKCVEVYPGPVGKNSFDESSQLPRVKMCIPCGATNLDGNGSIDLQCFNGECLSRDDAEAAINRIVLPGCGKCDRVSMKNTPECINSFTCSLKPECYECEDVCAILSQMHNIKLVCAADANDKFGCLDPYTIEVLSLDFIP